MTRKRQFSLRSLFLVIFWLCATLCLLRLLPGFAPSRLVDLLAIDNSQRAPFVLLVPAALLIAASTTTGAAVGAASNLSTRFAVLGAKLSSITAAIYFAVMAWTIWTDSYVTMLYSAVVALVTVWALKPFALASQSTGQ